MAQSVHPLQIVIMLGKAQDYCQGPKPECSVPPPLILHFNHYSQSSLLLMRNFIQKHYDKPTLPHIIIIIINNNYCYNTTRCLENWTPTHGGNIVKSPSILKIFFPRKLNF